MRNIPHKVFCIGFHKTGTTSMQLALEVLGYRVTGPNGVYNKNISEDVLPMAFKLVKEFDAFQDNPWPIIYKEIDEAVPESKFILTLRDEDKWVRSQVRHFGRRETPMRKWIYGVGCPEGNEDIYKERMRLHNRDVLKYFADRPDDLLVMDVTNGDGWDKLCPFLGHPVPEIKFPHANRAEERNATGGLYESVLSRLKKVTIKFSR